MPATKDKSSSQLIAAETVAWTLSMIDDLSILSGGPFLLRSLGENAEWDGVTDADQREARTNVQYALRERDLVSEFHSSHIEAWAECLSIAANWPGSNKVRGQLAELAETRRREGDSADSLTIRLGIIEDAHINEDFIFKMLTNAALRSPRRAGVTPSRLTQIAETVLTNSRFRLQRLSAVEQAKFGIVMQQTNEPDSKLAIGPSDLDTRATLENVYGLIEDQGRAYLGFQMGQTTIRYGLYGTKSVNRATFDEERMRLGDPERRLVVAAWLGKRAYERDDMQSFVAIVGIIADTHMIISDHFARRGLEAIQRDRVLIEDDTVHVMAKAIEHRNSAANYYRALVYWQTENVVPPDLQREAHKNLRLIELESGRHAFAGGDLKEAAQHFARADWHFVPATAPLGPRDASGRGPSDLQVWEEHSLQALSRILEFDQNAFFTSAPVAEP